MVVPCEYLDILQPFSPQLVRVVVSKSHIFNYSKNKTALESKRPPTFLSTPRREGQVDDGSQVGQVGQEVGHGPPGLLAEAAGQLGPEGHLEGHQAGPGHDGAGLAVVFPPVGDAFLDHVPRLCNKECDPTSSLAERGRDETKY